MPVINLHPFSWERMIRAVEKARERCERAVTAMNGAGIRYGVAGGNAVAAWVSRVDESAVRTPVDVELVLCREDLDKAKIALENAGFRCVKEFHAFLDGPRGSMRDAIRILFTNDKLVTDCDAVVPDVSEVDCSGPFPIVNLEPLARIHLANYRIKDRVGLLDLINVGLIDDTWSTRFTGELAARLQRLLDDPDKFSAFT